jgi:hypothetical protein
MLINSVDFEVVLAFQNQYVAIVHATLKATFKDNEIIVCFKIKNPTTMPFRQVGLASWGCVELEILCAHYGVEHQIDGKVYHPLINIATMKCEYIAFKW